MIEKVTGNAQLLLGLISGLVLQHNREQEGLPAYSVIEVDAAAGTVVFEATSGNQFRLSLVQIAGVE